MSKSTTTNAARDAGQIKRLRAEQRRLRDDQFGYGSRDEAIEREIALIENAAVKEGKAMGASDTPKAAAVPMQAAQFTILRRTFAAKQAKTTDERNALNTDVLTSEYFPSQRFLVRRVALMSDGAPNPVQPFHNHTFRTRQEAEHFAAQEAR